MQTVLRMLFHKIPFYVKYAYTLQAPCEHSEDFVFALKCTVGHKSFVLLNMHVHVRMKQLETTCISEMIFNANDMIFQNLVLKHNNL